MRFIQNDYGCVPQAPTLLKISGVHAMANFRLTPVYRCQLVREGSTTKTAPRLNGSAQRRPWPSKS